MASQTLTVELELSEALFLIVSAKLNHEFLESIQIDKEDFSESQMRALIQKLETLVGQNYTQITDEMLEELINSFLPELPIRTAGISDYSFPMYSIEETLPLLKEAIEARKIIEMEYYSMDREEINARKIKPYYIEKRYNYYIVMGYCLWREDVRLFRVDRIKSLEVSDENFEMPADFEASDYSDDDHV